MPLIAEHELYRRLVAARPVAAGPQTTPVRHAASTIPGGVGEPTVPGGVGGPTVPGRAGEAVEAALAADRRRWPQPDIGITCLFDTTYLSVCGDICAAGRALGEAGYGHLLVRAGAIAADIADALTACGLTATIRSDVRLASPPGLHHLTTVAISDPPRER